MRNRVMLTAAVLCLAMGMAAAEETGKSDDRAERRARVDAMAEETLNALLDASDSARELYGKSAGYAVFDNLKLSLFLSGGGGVGVAVHKESGERTYMKMGTAGVNIGLGGQKYQVVFLFHTARALESFIDKGWAAETQANAVAGTAGANAESSFKNDIAFYQLTEAGLMLQADIAGTKYWKNKKLNRN